MSGFVIRSSELIKSQPNFPLTHVEIAFTGPSEGCTFKILRPFVQTSNEATYTTESTYCFCFFGALTTHGRFPLQKRQKYRYSLVQLP